MKMESISRWICLAALAALTGCSSLDQHGPSAAVELFNGRNLDGWGHVLADAAVPRGQVWSVRDGILVCQGDPLGFLYTDRLFENFRLQVEYRWAPGAQPGNSGLFSRIQEYNRPLPRCIEVQLKRGSAGDVLGLQGVPVAASQPRYFHVAAHPVAGEIHGVGKLADAEAPAGEWNRVEILAQDSRYTVWINGQQVNDVTGVAEAPGPIGLQSEGGEIHFRRVAVTPLP
ncbi:MAG: DUF1080 domain-containing protein [Verrucomicrobia bacterium]|nr:DUF1080 domain-containing protein [Verrucomicrobiota bacterium]